MHAAFIQKACRSIGGRRPELFGKEPRISNYMLTIDMQLLTYPQFRKIHILKGCLQRTMKLQGRERNRLLSLPAFALLPPCHIHHDAVVNDFLATTHKGRTATEDNQISFLLPLNHCEPVFYPLT